MMPRDVRVTKPSHAADEGGRPMNLTVAAMHWEGKRGDLGSGGDCAPWVAGGEGGLC